MQIRNTIMATALLGVMSFTSINAYAKSISAEDFVQKASVSSEFEIESSNLAMQKSQNNDIKNFAQQMVTDHTQAAQKLQAALQSSNSNIKPEETLDDKHQDPLNQLNEASGKDFDGKYIMMQTDAHKEAVGLFSNYSKQGKNSALKSFASDTLPTLKDHLKHVQQLKSNSMTSTH